MPAPVADTSELLQLEIEKTKLLIPQAQVSAIESITDMMADDANSLSVGAVVHAGRAFSVFNFDADLQLIRAMPVSRKMCLCICVDEVVFALACDAINRLDKDQVELVELPVCMQAGTCPVSHIGIHKERIYSLISVRALYRLIAHSGKGDYMSSNLAEAHR